jgi:diaminopimelate decarboxylase
MPTNYRKSDLLRSFSGVDLKINTRPKQDSTCRSWLMQMQGTDVEVVSVNEARMARDAGGFEPGQIMYTPSGNAPGPKSRGSLLRVRNRNADSLAAARTMETYGDRFAALRINPSIAERGGTSARSVTGHENSNRPEPVP